MGIKQQGGIFGRNPTFNNVNVDGILTVDQIVEKTGAAGITLDGVTLKDGNVVLADGKGIDFSATSGTGTSELFDDYEEGTWTPAFSVFNGSFSAITYNGRTGGWYTKIGNLVHVSGYIATDSLTVGVDGDLWITGLPFTSSNTQPAFSKYPPAYVGEAKNWTAKAPSSLYVYPNNTFMVPLYRSAADGNVLGLLASDLATGSQDNELAFAATYTVD